MYPTLRFSAWIFGLQSVLPVGILFKKPFWITGCSRPKQANTNSQTLGGRPPQREASRSKDETGTVHTGGGFTLHKNLWRFGQTATHLRPVSGRSGAWCLPAPWPGYVRIRGHAGGLWRLRAARHSLWSHEVWLNSQLYCSKTYACSIHGSSSNFRCK